MDTLWFTYELTSPSTSIPGSTTIIATTAFTFLVLAIILLSRRFGKSKPDTVTTEKNVTSINSFRISDISSDTTEAVLRQLLEGLVPGETNAGVIVGLSLAASSASSDASRYKTAVVTFSTVPEVLRTCLLPAKTVTINLPRSIKSNDVCVDTHFLGLTPLNSEPNPTVDIVAVTGLAGHAFGSWKAKGGSKMWLRDFLAHDLVYDHYHTRILTYGYDSTLIGSTSDSSIHEFARKLLEALKASREQPHETHRPIIFIAHSLGGLVLKHALTEASKGDVRDKAVFKSCYAAFFFGVPNRGLHITHLVSMAKGRKLVEDLGENSQVLPMIHREFQRVFVFEDAKIYSIYETKDTRAVKYNPTTNIYERTGDWIRMVSRDSATNSSQNERIYQQLSIDEDHSNMVKFDNRNSPDYIMVRTKIKECVEEAPRAIMKRLPQHRKSVQPRTDEEKECLRSLVPSSNDPTSRLPAMTIHPGTCEWLLQNEAFKAWHTSGENESKILWVHGQPGTGKTALMTFVQSHLAQNPDNDVIHFFCNDTYMERRTAMSVLKSLVHQLLAQNSGRFKYIMPEYEKFKIDEEKRWSAAALWNTFRAIMTDPTGGPIYCIIDALDECVDSPGENEYSRSDLLRGLYDLFLSPSAPACAGCIVVSSRPLTDIEEALATIKQTIRLEDYNDSDISLYISDQLDKLAKRLKYPPGLREEVEDTLKEKSGNMFLWVTLTVGELGKRYTAAHVRQLLTTVPRSLFAYYEHILSSIPPDRIPRARCILMWIAHAANPIPLQDLALLVAIDDTTHSIADVQDMVSMDIEVEIRDLCGPFVKIVGSCVMLVHQSVGDFLMADSAQVSKLDPSIVEPAYHRQYHISSQEANANLLGSCIAYLSFPDRGIFDGSPNSLSDDGLNDQADGSVSQPGGPHSGQLESQSNNLSNSEALPYPALAWPIHARLIDPHDKKTGDALYEFIHSAHFTFWKEHCWWNELFWGSFFRPKYNQDAKCSTIQPLYVAAQLHVRPLVQLLLDGGADVHNGGGLYHNALQCAACNGGDFSIVKLLVENGANVNALGGYHGTALMAAIVSGNMAIVAYILKNGADVKIEGGHWGCPLQAAAFRGRLDMVKLLLRHGVAMDDNCGEFGNPLLAAAWSGHLPVVEFFLDHGMHPDTRGRLNGFPLQAATRRKQYAVVNKLLEWGASVNLVGGVMGSALHAAIGTKEPRLVQLLISRSADVNMENAKKGPPLHFAASVGHFGIVQSLVTAGAKWYIKDSEGNTPRDIAIRKGHSRVAEYLGRREEEGEEGIVIV